MDSVNGVNSVTGAEGTDHADHADRADRTGRVDGAVSGNVDKGGGMSGASPYRLVGARPEPGFEVRVDGRAVPVVPGQTVGAALHAAGIRTWRTTRFGDRRRGLFCGIGVCFDCLVTVNGVENLRACLTEARPGDEVTTS